MKNGDFIYARTHADFLNQAFGTNYKAWMKCVWPYTDEIAVWMVRFNKTDGGWRNTFISENRIKEENLNHVTEWGGMPVTFERHKKRLVIEIDDSGSRRKYIFRGLYAFDEKNSNALFVKYHDKISDEFYIFKETAVCGFLFC